MSIAKINSEKMCSYASGNFATCSIRVCSMLSVILLAVSVCRADIVTSGDINPANPSSWSLSDMCYIGNTADGEITVNGGSDVRSYYIYLGYSNSVTGKATITGAGSTWTNNNYNYLGYDGTGELNITNGGTVSNSNFTYMGHNSNSSGKLLIDGTSSSYISNNNLIVGRSGSGEITIKNGGTLTGARTYIGQYTNSSGSVTVDGAGSTFSNPNGLWVGNYGSGSLTISNGGLVSVAQYMTIDYNSTYDSQINISTGGMLALSGDECESITEFLALISGTAAVYYCLDNTENWRHITEGTEGIDYTLSYITDTGNSLYGYNILTVATGSGTAVPEPKTLVILAFAMSILMWKKYTRSY